MTKTHSRPHVSNDNPFSEAGFKTLKYRPDFPARFGCIEDARAYCVDFFAWHNGEHYHSGIGLQTPNDVHYGRAQQRIDDRAAVLAAAHLAHPERFVRGAPRLPTAVWINKPIADQSDQIEINSLNSCVPVSEIEHASTEGVVLGTVRIGPHARTQSYNALEAGAILDLAVRRLPIVFGARYRRAQGSVGNNVFTLDIERRLPFLTR